MFFKWATSATITPNILKKENFMIKVSITAIFLALVTGFLCFKIPDITYPFVISFILSYLLNPLAIILRSKFGMSRFITAIIISVSLIILMVTALIYLVPLIYTQISALIHHIPEYESYLIHNIVPFVVEKMGAIDPQISSRLKVIADQGINGVFEVFSHAVHNVWSYTMATIHLLLFMILVPVLLFFLLRDWDAMSNGFFDLFPKYHQKFVKTLFKDIDNVLGAYLRGEMIVCSILSIYYSIGLTVIGMDFAILLGVLCGFSIILPLIGTIIVVISLASVGYFTFGFSAHMVYIGILYIFGAAVEGAALTPKIIGDSLGVSPVWIIFSVLLFGYIAGPVGILMAIPTTGVIKVILTHLKHDYQKSVLYNSKI